jgi:hypothetical protein
VTVTDPGSAEVDTTSLKYQRTNNTTAPSTGSFTLGFTNGSDITKPNGEGDRYLRIFAQDTAKNTIITGSQVFKLDNTTPVVTFTPIGSGTYQQSHSTKVTVTDTGAGVASLEYQWTMTGAAPTTGFKSFNSGDTLTLSGENGDRFLRIRATDNAGNIITTNSQVFKMDNTTPIVTFNPLGNGTAAQSHTTIVTVNDGKSGIATLKYQRTTNGNTAPATGSFATGFTNGSNITLSGMNGNRYLRILATDNAGNTIITGSNAFNFDNTLPVVTFTPNGSGTYQQSHTTQVNVTDNNAGIATLKYQRTNNGNTTPTTGSFVSGFTNGSSLTLSGENGDRYLRILATDSAENTIITRSNVFKMDNTTPVVTFAPIGSGIYQQSHSTVVGATDGKSQIKTLEYQWTMTGAAPTTGFKSFNSGDTLTLSGENGDRYLRIRATDNAGNIITTNSQVFKMDNTTPIVTLTPNGSGTYQQSHTTPVDLFDGNAGITTGLYLWTMTGTAPATGSFSTASGFTSGDTLTLSGVNEDRYLRILATDNAGNTIITGSNVFKMDNTTPVITFSPIGSGTAAQSHTTIVTITDGKSGVAT